MSSELSVALISILLTGIVTFVTTNYFAQRQEKKQIIETSVSSVPLVDPSLIVNTPLLVQVRAQNIGNETSEKDLYVPVKSAHGFSILCKNVGNETVEAPKIEVELSQDAKIVQHAFKLNHWADDNIVGNVDSHKRNIYKLAIPYLNKNQEITINLTSVSNWNSDCKIRVWGKGIEHRSSQEHFSIKQHKKSIQYNLGIIIVACSILLIIRFDQPRALAYLAIFAFAWILFAFLSLIYSLFILYLRKDN